MYVLSTTVPVPSLGVSIPDDPVEQVLILILSCNLGPHQVAEDHLTLGYGTAGPVTVALQENVMFGTHITIITISSCHQSRS